jgi:glycosyltransferase involved in cell wall biosynthesis
MISVLLPAYNAESTIAEAISSVLAQTFSQFEVLIVDDGSTDKTSQVIGQFSDPRIRVIRQETNQGLVATLNRGLHECKYDWIARLDSDDRMVSTRLAEQWNWVSAHPKVAILGSSMLMIDERGQPLGMREAQCGSQVLEWKLLFENPLFHPTVLMNRKFVQEVGGYREEAKHAEDYDLWVRIVHAGYKLENLPAALTEYRIHPDQISQSQTPAMVRQSRKTAQAAMQNLVAHPVSESVVQALQERKSPYELRPEVTTRLAELWARWRVRESLANFPIEAQEDLVWRFIGIYRNDWITGAQMAWFHQRYPGVGLRAWMSPLKRVAKKIR